MSSRSDKFRQLAENYKTDEVMWFALGMELVREERWEDGRAAFEKAIALKPAYTTAYRELGKIYVKLERPSEAEHTFKQGQAVAEQTGDLQVAKEIEVLARRLMA